MSNHETSAPCPVHLDHAAIMSTNLDESISFYREMLGLELQGVEDDPVREGRRRALLTDAAGRPIIEIIEMPEMAHPTIAGRGGIHHIGFRLKQRDWHALRSRLDASTYPYQEVQGRLFIRDHDGLVLELEQAA